jgi:phosphopantetheine attachment domain protein
MFEEKILKNIILKNAKIIDINKVVFDKNLSFESDLGMDSIGLVEMIVEIEKKFEFEFDYDNLSNVINTYGALKKYVEENCKED